MPTDLVCPACGAAYYTAASGVTGATCACGAELEPVPTAEETPAAA